MHPNGQEKDRHVGDALAHIRRHLADELSVEDIVAATSVSRRTLERRFREELSCTIYQALVRARLQLAQHLLSNTKLSVTQVAAQSGFSSLGKMDVVFQRELGKRPTELRKELLSASIASPS